jgi:hypothetical protein
MTCGRPESAFDLIDTDLGQTARTTQGRLGFGREGVCRRRPFERKNCGACSPGGVGGNETVEDTLVSASRV